MPKDLFAGIIDFIKSLYPDENPVPLHVPRFTGNEKKYVIDAIDSTFVSSVGEYVHDVTGYNYRLPNLNAALACAQLEQLDSFIDRKRKLAETYKTFFESLGIPFIHEPEHARSNYWLNTIILPDSKTHDEFLKVTNNANVMTRPVWRLLSKLDMYKTCQTDALTNAKWLEERVVNIPSSVIV